VEEEKIMGEGIEYRIKESARARRMRISVYRDGRVIVTVPRRFNLDLIGKFVNDKKDWIVSKVRKFMSSPLRCLGVARRGDYKKYKDEAKVLVEAQLKHFNQFYNFKYNKITIRNQKTRWGSCSRRGNLNFSYKIIHLPEDIRDYIVVHELCHLGEFNHSRNFWNLVGKTVPNYLELRRGLRVK
jgi:hypothetical protein